MNSSGVLALPGLKYGDLMATWVPVASKTRNMAYKPAALTMLMVSWSPAPRSTRYKSTSSTPVTPALIFTLWLSPSAEFSAVASVSPTSAAGVRSPSAVITTLLARSVLAPPAVETTISPALTPLGITSVSSCWSVLAPPLPSMMVRTLKLPTARPSTVIARSLAVKPVPSSTMVLPTTTAPPNARSVGTICRFRLVPLPSTVTMPVRASAGTTTLSVVPPAPTVPVRVSVPKVPLSSSPWNCTSVLLVKPWPWSTMLWPVTALGASALAGLPALAFATMAVKTLVGCAPKPALASCA